MKRKLLWGIVMSLLSVAMAHAQYHGLGNATKSFTPAAEMLESDWKDPAEVQKTWNAAIVRVPTGDGQSRAISTAALLEWLPETGQIVPVVIYMHGCSGIWPGTHRRLKFMAELGFVAIAPASFAREKYPKSYDPETHRAARYRGTLKMRQYDAAYAIRQASRLPFVEQRQIVLMGLSQGGITAATLGGRQYQLPLAARIIEGWTCNSGWKEYNGLNARTVEPVLSLVGEKDPWFQNAWTRGDCGRFMQQEHGSRSVVYRSGALSRAHELLENQAVQDEVVEFLKDIGVLE